MENVKFFLAGRNVWADFRDALSKKLQKENNWELIEPFDDYRVMAGQVKDILSLKLLDNGQVCSLSVYY